MKNYIKPLLYVGIMAVSLPSQAALIGFHFTGNLMVVDGAGTILNNTDDFGNTIPLSPISATLNYDTDSGIGGSNMSIVMDGGYWNSPATFHDIRLERLAGTNTINGEILVDWNGNTDMQMHVSWNARGLLNAIEWGLNVGDTISGTTLKQDTTGDGTFDTFTDVLSETPYSDTLLNSNFEGPAPLAATNDSLGLGFDINGNPVFTPFNGIKGLVNIGSGNSLTVTSVSTVPIPAAAWLFGSGLIGLAGIARRKKS